MAPPDLNTAGWKTSEKVINHAESSERGQSALSAMLTRTP
jgi:hypothetical protein